MTAVSSTASCSSAAASVTSSRPRSARITATPSGCAMYGSPERRIWSLVRVARDLVGPLDQRRCRRRVAGRGTRSTQRPHRTESMLPCGRCSPPDGSVGCFTAAYSYSSTAWTSWPASLVRPSRDSSSMQEREADDLAAEPLDQPGGRRPRCRRWRARRRRSAPARPGAPRRGGSRAGRCRTRARTPRARSPTGACPALRTGTNPAPRAGTRPAPRTRSPRASIPTTLSIGSSANGAARASTASGERVGRREQRRDVLEDDPGCGQSGMSRTSSRNDDVSTDSRLLPLAYRRRLAARRYLRLRPRCWRARGWIGGRGGAAGRAPDRARPAGATLVGDARRRPVARRRRRRGTDPDRRPRSTRPRRAACARGARCSAWYCGSRSFHHASSGAATKIDEYDTDEQTGGEREREVLERRRAEDHRRRRSAATAPAAARRASSTASASAPAFSDRLTISP